MARQPSRERKTSVMEVAMRLHALQTPEVAEYLERTLERYGKYAVSADEVRAMMDDALGERTVTAELDNLNSR